MNSTSVPPQPAFATVSLTPNSAGWNTTSPTLVNIGALDRSCGFGVQKITYSASDAQPTTSTDVPGAAAAVAITTNGVTTVTYTATDAAGNTSPVQTITVRLDTAGPVITIVRSAAGTYLYRQPVTAPYSCTDATSGVASCVGTVPNSSPINTSTLGSPTFTVNATDNATNPSTKTVTYNVAYRICLLYDPNRPVRMLGQVIISLRICDTNGNNLSSSNITLTAAASPALSPGPSPAGATTPRSSPPTASPSAPRTCPTATTTSNSPSAEPTPPPTWHPSP
ncbi:hypothetical protein ACFQ7Z_32955 [Streptomyces virginiae]|uniref:hypothetical protein n=1 Tax=Streptomyces virginiae TaxID=1961 RepID=UPI00368A9ED2